MTRRDAAITPLTALKHVQTPSARRTCYPRQTRVSHLRTRKAEIYLIIPGRARLYLERAVKEAYNYSTP